MGAVVSPNNIQKVRAKNELFFGHIKSLSAHIGLGIIIVVCSLFIVSGTSEQTKDQKIEILKSAVRVDVVGMPKFTLQELKQMTMDDFQATTVTDEKVNEEVGGSDKVIFEKKAKKINIGNLLSGFSNRKLNKVKKRKKSKLNLSARKLKALALEGNAIAKGNALLGDSGTQVDMGKFSTYANNLPNVIRQFWKLPSYLMNKDFKCRIQVFISSAGRIINVKIYESSGNQEYDQKALASVRSVTRFPSPDPEFSKLVSDGAIILGFPL
jgi:colicin import membrane protein